jgi:hypothetical protein
MSTPAIPLDVLDVLAAHGWTLDMVRAAWRAGWAIAAGIAVVSASNAGATPAVASVAVASVAHATSAKTSTQRSREFRQRKQAGKAQAGVQRETVASSVAVAPLSLSSNFKFIKEREREGHSESFSRLLALPADWQPNEMGAKLAAAELGDTAAANCLAKFRDHYEAVGGRLRTERQWQALFRKWVRNERSFTTSTQRNLPLMRHVKGGKQPGRDSPSTVWKLEKAVEETLQRARESG